MAANGRRAAGGFEPSRSCGAPPLIHARSPGYSSHHRRQSSIPEEMFAIDENREDDFSDTQPLTKRHVHATENEVSSLHNQTSQDQSILRRLTRKLTSAKSTQSTRSARASVDCVPVDLSTLEGLGIELTEVSRNRAAASEQVNIEDTSHRGAADDMHKPSFSDFRKRRKIGAGMVVGAKLQRDTSRLEHSGHSAAQDNMQRINTVRKLGQDLADKHGQMVSYSDGVDLSSLEGVGPNIRRSTTFDDMSITRQGTIPDTNSYFFPADPQIPNWKPFSMRAPYIIMLITIALGLAGFQEYLCQTSLRKQAQDPPSGLLSFNSVDDVSVWKFFVWKYFPTMVTITYSVLFSIMDFDIRRLEPYYQLSQPSGARASASLNLDHLTMFQYFVPFNALRLRQWAVFASTFANIIAATIAPALQNPAINFEKNPNRNCLDDGCPLPDSDMKAYWVTINPIWSRLLTSSYLIVTIVTIILFFQLRRKSGLLSDPRGIAGIASMATKSHILQDFAGTDLATRGDIHKKLAHRTYILYKSSIWQGEWTRTADPAITDSYLSKDKRLQSPHPIMLQLRAGIPFILMLIFCLAGVPLISITPLRIIPKTVPWLPILITTILKMIWSTFEADVRLIEPFYQLSLGNCTPENSLALDYQGMVYGIMPIKAALNGHYLVMLVGISSVLLDILSVTIGSFSVDSGVFIQNQHRATPNPSSEDESFISFTISLALSLFILIFVISVAALVYLRRRHPFLPREPSTIASVLSFIYSSKMLTDFIDTELLDHKSMETRLKNTGKRYALGWVRGRDGRVHCAIDEEPIVSKYVHGMVYGDMVSGPMGRRETEYWA